MGVWGRDSCVLPCEYPEDLGFLIFSSYSSGTMSWYSAGTEDFLRRVTGVKEGTPEPRATGWDAVPAGGGRHGPARGDGERRMGGLAVSGRAAGDLGASAPGFGETGPLWGSSLR